MDDIRRRFEGREYDFLRGNPDLKNCIYLTLSGSRGYGTNVAGSDLDLRGVLVEPARYLYGLETFGQFEDVATDTVIYGLKKYVSMCADGNPNALELLGTDEDSIVFATPAGRLLRENAGLFLSRRVVGSFGNYAMAQLRRLSNALCRDRYDEAEQERHLCNTLKRQLDHFNRKYATIDETSMRIYMEDDNLLFDIGLRGYPIRDFAGIYGEIHNIIKTYGKLNHRNRKKDDAHLCKHAMHLIRLLITGKDILDGKGIITKRKEECDLLLDIRNGRYSFDDIFAMAEKYQMDFDESAKKTALPKQVDIDKIEALMMEIYRVHYTKSQAQASMDEITMSPLSPPPRP